MSAVSAQQYVGTAVGSIEHSIFGVWATTMAMVESSGDFEGGNQGSAVVGIHLLFAPGSTQI